MTDDDRTKRGSRFKLFVGVSIVIGLAIAATQYNLPHLLQALLLWVKQLGAVGAIAFIAIYSLTTVILFPSSLVTLSGGALFGVVLGTVYVLLGAVVGATLAFLIGRYLARDWVSQQMEANPSFQAIDAAVAQEGLKLVLLTRLSPLFPFTLLNYAFGITQVALKDYLLGFIGIVPGTVTYVYIGSLAGNVATASATPSSDQAQPLQWLLRLVGLIATIAVTLYITRIARKALNETQRSL